MWPLLRDSGIYIFVVGLLALILADGVVTWYEALILVILYFVYFILMFTQKKIKSVANRFLVHKSSFSCEYNIRKFLSVLQLLRPNIILKLLTKEKKK